MGPDAKKQKSEDHLQNDLPVSCFLAWCKKVGLELNPKVYISTEGTVSQYGMLAREDLSDGELLFSIPRSAILSQNTTRIRDLIEKEQDSLQSCSGWVPLLISLLYEATDSSSHWAPYFGLWPELDPPDMPMFWSEEEQTKLLQGTGILEAVHKDLKNIEKEYNSIVLPFIRRNPEKFCPMKHTLDLYKRLVAFVMAYSFQEPQEEDEEEDIEKDILPPMMVPVADLLNHVAQHNAHLEFTPECLRMITTKSVCAGQELFNTYGQMANWQLLHMYGFAEPHPQNCNETADIQMVTVREAAFQVARTEEDRLEMQKRWDFLCHIEIVGEEGAFVFGLEEVMTEEELKACLKVLCMSTDEFAEYKENDGWEEDEDNDEQTLLTQEISRLPIPWRKLLHLSAELTLKAYTTELSMDEALVNDPTAYAKLSSREQHSLQVQYGQKKILHLLLELTKS
uniref:N-lysine methyltransferase SETD6 n=1 Tax=Xenopus tropicalis TaxID=8364 RepID=A0A5S6M7R8_XENTR